jgi:hypothetical protein
VEPLASRLASVHDSFSQAHFIGCPTFANSIANLLVGVRFLEGQLLKARLRDVGN